MKFTFDPKFAEKKNFNLYTHFVVLKSTAKAGAAFMTEGSANDDCSVRNQKAEKLQLDARYVVCPAADGTPAEVIC